MTMPPDDLRALLARLGLSQMGLARLLAVNPRTVRGWCAGTRPPPEIVRRFLLVLAAHPRAVRTLDNLNRAEG